jgi:poly-gamma-glutamate system protein
MKLRYAILAFAFACAGFAVLYLARGEEPFPLRDIQLRAAARMERAEAQLKETLVSRGIPIEAELDPARTGLIGPEWTALTTTLGNLEAKRSALNPNFAALMVRYFHEAGLKSGDTIAVGASGSFPGLVIATLCAAEEMGITAYTIASYGSSMYGATRPEFTIAEMLKILSAASYFPDSLIAVSPGSEQDFGESTLYPESRELIAALARQSGAEFINFDKPDLAASIQRRLTLYREHAEGEKIKCFVNIGGASPNNGTSAYTLDFPQGLVLKPPRIPTSANRGLIYEFAAQGIPVINLLNIRLLTDRHGLPYDPVPLPRAGEGGVYREIKYNKLVIALSLAASLATLGAGIAEKRKRTLADSVTDHS